MFGDLLSEASDKTRWWRHSCFCIIQEWKEQTTSSCRSVYVRSFGWCQVLWCYYHLYPFICFLCVHIVQNYQEIMYVHQSFWNATKFCCDLLTQNLIEEFFNDLLCQYFLLVCISYECLNTGRLLSTNSFTKSQLCPTR